MITRQRDLDAIAYGNPRDVWLVDDGNGLAYALIGMVPERRPALPALYGGLTLQTASPSAITRPIFSAFGRDLVQHLRDLPRRRLGACVRTLARHDARVLGCHFFSIEPYQLGLGNEEGIESGAWWFYTKLDSGRVRAQPSGWQPQS